MRRHDRFNYQSYSDKDCNYNTNVCHWELNRTSYKTSKASDVLPYLWFYLVFHLRLNVFDPTDNLNKIQFGCCWQSYTKILFFFKEKTTLIHKKYSKRNLRIGQHYVIHRSWHICFALIVTKTHTCILLWYLEVLFSYKYFQEYFLCYFNKNIDTKKIWTWYIKYLGCKVYITCASNRKTTWKLRQNLQSDFYFEFAGYKIMCLKLLVCKMY